jgi:dihydrofolate synthase/folylpolyglutamate synthase
LPQRSLDEWLSYVDSIHPRTIELGLERVIKARDELSRHWDKPFAGVVVTVGGTNGKGSTCAMLEAILLAAGYRTGLYTSPHLLRYTERIRVQGREIGEKVLCRAFERVEAARLAAGVSLTYFEFGTLACWDLFVRAGLEVAVMEVGLGGRLDAVNLLDADCAVITSVDLDHMDYLGDTREAIGREKAGIFRAGRPAVIADPMPPVSMLDYARDIGAHLRLIGRDFGYQGDRQQWGFWSLETDGQQRGALRKRPGLAYPALRGANQLLNASAALAALDALRERIPVGMQDVRLGLASVTLPGRFQVLPGRPAVVLDVAHNPHAAAVLSENLSNMGFFPSTHAVFAMLADKDVEGVCRRLKGRIDVWHVAPLPGPRGGDAEALASAITRSGAGGVVHRHASPHEAYAAARSTVNENDRIVVFGSFLTVADVLQSLPGVPA